MKKNKVARKIIVWTALLVIFAFIVVTVDWEGTLSLIRKGDLLFIVLALIVTFARFIIWTKKWQMTISSLESVPFLKMFPILMAGMFLNQVTPGRDTGGEPVRAYYLSKISGLNKRQSLATILLDKSGNYIAISTFIGFAIFFIILFIRVSPSIKLLLEGVVIVFTLVVISAAIVKKNLKIPSTPALILKKIYFFAPLKKLREQFLTYAHFETYVMERVNDFITTLKNLFREKKTVRDNLLLSYLIWFLVFVKTYLIFLAFGAKASIFLIIAVESISILLGIISFMPGGFGATEVTMIALFGAAGIDVETATAVTVVSRGIYYAYTLGLGYASFLYLKIRAG